MDIVTKLWISFMFLVPCHTKDWKHEIYMQGENATICIDQQASGGKEMLEITFSSYTSKLDPIRVMLYFPMKKRDLYTRMYTGRVHHIKVNNASFSFILQHVDFVDSGHYTAFGDSRELGKASVIVPRRTLLGDYNELVILSFIYNTANISAIQIDMITSTRTIFVVMYDVRKGNCTESGQHYIYRIQNCVFKGKNFSFTIRDVSWLDKGVYAAWDSTDILLDSVLLDMRESNELSSTERSNGYCNSSCVTNPACSEAENEVWVRLLFAAVGVTVTVPLTVACTLLIQWRRNFFQFTYKGPDCYQHSLIDITSDQALKMGPISKNTTNRAAIEERDYLEPLSNTTDPSMYLEPIGIETVHTEENNPSGSCIKEYEKLHPYGNQGNNTYSSLGKEHTIQVSKRPTI